ncbi:hypothetical protein HDU87_000295 [Geranomyces variabilis]|uniref:G-protein coupled receptors family 1 profile domain-containing protein n=1 Tax=Geranomyces variabilis TaxID=109894 RepID=A0AAD5TSB0_9FUNG|nr:hypothetical protein HDU87_000295 [Geranomyces variabilis]
MTDRDWIGIPAPHRNNGMQTGHLIVSVLVQGLSVSFASFTIAVFVSSTRLRCGNAKWHNWLVLFDSVADLFMNIFQWGAVIVQIYNGGWYFGDGWCQFQGYTSTLFGFLSVNGVVLLTHERAYSIIFEKEWTEKHTILGALFACISSAFVASIYMWHGNRFALQESGIYCCPDYAGQALRPQPDPQLNRDVSLFVLVIMIFNILAIATVYCLIFVVVSRVSRNVMHLNAETLDPETTGIKATRITSFQEGAPPSASARSFPDEIADNIHLQKEWPDCDRTLNKIKAAAGRSKIEKEIAIKCITMTASLLALWCPTLIKIGIAVSTRAPVNPIFDIWAALSSISPGIVPRNLAGRVFSPC